MQSDIPAKALKLPDKLHFTDIDKRRKALDEERFSVFRLFGY